MERIEHQCQEERRGKKQTYAQNRQEKQYVEIVAAEIIDCIDYSRKSVKPGKKEKNRDLVPVSGKAEEEQKRDHGNTVEQHIIMQPIEKKQGPRIQKRRNTRRNDKIENGGWDEY